MISIITPFYNAGHYLQEAIQSVLYQSEPDWELLLVNDGSTDTSKRIALSFNDHRIKYFEQPNKGVAMARNLGLANMKGDYFCFLDADDTLAKNSLKSRLQLFKNTRTLSFVDGQVIVMDKELRRIHRTWTPDFIGNPLRDLVLQNGKCFFNSSWMIKRDAGKEYCFHQGLTHGEDLLFLMELAREGGEYTYVSEPILQYRNTPGSAMKNLEGLEKGYRYIGNMIENWPELSIKERNIYDYRWRRAMFLSYLRAGEIKNSVKVFLKKV